MLFHLAYVSRETRPLSQDDLLDLLEVSRRRNADADITGMLLHRDGAFMQVLEGSRDACTETFDRIRGDGRHEQIRTLYQGDLRERAFTDWSMGFAIPVELDGVDGLTDFLDRDDGLADDDAAGLSQQLLRAFRDGR